MWNARSGESTCSRRSPARPGATTARTTIPACRGYEPSRREWDDALADDPIEWVGKQLSDLDALVELSDIDPGEIDADDARQLREAVPEILERTRTLLARVHAGELGQPPKGYVESSEPVLRCANGWL